MKGRFTVLGTSSAIPTKERNHPAVYLQYGPTALLFDCGEGTQRQIQKAELSFFKIDHIFITHLHGDHTLGLPGLLQTLDFHEKEKVSLFGPPGLKKLVELSTRECFFVSTGGLEVEVKEFEPSDEPFEVLRTESFTVRAVGLDHTVPCLGYSFEEPPKFKFDKELVKRLGLRAHHFKELEKKGETAVGGRVYRKEELGTLRRGFKWCYLTDTYYTENLFKLTEGADFVVLECTYLDEEETAKEVKHLTLKTFAEKVYPVFREQGVKTVVLTHFSRRYKDLKPFEEAIKRYGLEGVVLAKDLLTFEF
ncbi:MAG: ribonuclease Z [Aquificae bacterium]|nr:ribonuclease Z [Aquificota bacterium]